MIINEWCWSDPYNAGKQWLIQRDSHYHYFLTQFIYGRRYSKKVRTTKKHIEEIFGKFKIRRPAK